MQPLGCVTGPVVWSVAIAGLLAVAGCGAERLGPPEEVAQYGKPAAASPAPMEVSTVSEAEPIPEPDVTLATAKELREAIESGKGGIVVVNFWATWCPPCVKEMPELARFYRDYADDGLHFLSISADHYSTRDSTVVPFVKSYELPFPVRIMHLESPDDLENELPLEWDGALPATFVFGPEGSVAKSWIGPVTYDILAEAVWELRRTASESVVEHGSHE